MPGTDDSFRDRYVFLTLVAALPWPCGRFRTLANNGTGTAINVRLIQDTTGNRPPAVVAVERRGFLSMTPMEPVSCRGQSKRRPLTTLDTTCVTMVCLDAHQRHAPEKTTNKTGRRQLHDHCYFEVGNRHITRASCHRPRNACTSCLAGPVNYQCVAIDTGLQQSKARQGGSRCSPRAPADA